MPIDEERHPIQVVTRRTGLSPDVLRAWERRYGAVHPRRSAGKRRLYSDGDIERLLLLRRATLGGRSIGQVAALETRRLRDLVEADQQAAAAAPTEPSAAPLPQREAPERREVALEEAPLEPSRLLDAALAATAALDVAGLEDALTRAVVSMSPTRTIDELLVPLMQRVGDRWQDGELRIVNEHVATAVARTFLGHLARHHDYSAAPTIVGCTLRGQRHELGTLTAIVTAISCGWNAVWLGGELPAPEIASAVRQLRARAVAIGFTFPAGDPAVHSELEELRRLLERVPILAGGAAAPSYAGTLSAIGARRINDMAALREALRDLASGAAR
jgi:DNA-binding transcriptional MerR regulator